MKHVLLIFALLALLQRVDPSSPNILLVLTDDLDHTLGSVNAALPQTQRLIGGNGATASNWFVHTPVCCPSRAELLTGRYFHNIRVHNHSQHGCMFVNVSTNTSLSPFYATPEHQGWYFAPHFKALNYTVGVFGKHLNSDNPLSPPPGVDRWFVNGGGDYLNPSFSVANVDQVGTTVRFNNCSGATADQQLHHGSCYSTSVIGNQTMAWVRRHVLSNNHRTTRSPFFAYVALKAPHIQDGPGWPVAIPAPWHKGVFHGTKAPRTPNWNYTCTTCHWLIRTQPTMTSEQCLRSDVLYASRLEALLSVDDTVSDMIHELSALNVLNNTYVIFTSDHGFQFGQYGMPEGKWNAYEHDVRIPFLMRGPGIPAGSVYPGLGSNVDVMPTLLDLGGGGGVPPTSMDGASVAAGFLAQGTINMKTEQLIEYYGLGPVVRYEHLEDTPNNTFRVLRIIDPNGPVNEKNLMYGEWTSLSWDYTNDLEEVELFDLDKDPWQLINIATKASNGLKRRLHERLAQLYACRGDECRN
jgi:N-acetylglucosamine-6-sulfatase